MYTNIAHFPLSRYVHIGHARCRHQTVAIKLLGPTIIVLVIFNTHFTFSITTADDIESTDINMSNNKAILCMQVCSNSCIIENMNTFVTLTFHDFILPENNHVLKKLSC